MQIDVRGLSCPLPLMHTKKALEARPDSVTVLVTSGTAKANVVSFLEDEGFTVRVAGRIRRLAHRRGAAMSLRERIGAVFRRLAVAEPQADGLFLFDEVGEALRGERVLRAAGYALRLVAPPASLRAGCDLAIALPPFERPGAERALCESGVVIRGWADGPEGTRALADLVTVKDFGEFLMVRAGNMKITVEKATGLIVNTSGGGCPDIPHLNLALVGRTLFDSSGPRQLGLTLCGLMLDRAFEEAKARLAGEDR